MKKILIIEDDKFLRELIIRKLKDEGFEIHFAVDGEEGLKKIKEEKPDLVLLDLILPGCNGFDLLKTIKADGDKVVSSIPIIILSNLGQDEDIKKGMELGAADFLIKAHFTLGEIVGKIKNLKTGNSEGVRAK